MLLPAKVGRKINNRLIISEIQQLCSDLDDAVRIPTAKGISVSVLQLCHGGGRGAPRGRNFPSQENKDGDHEDDGNAEEEEDDDTILVQNPFTVFLNGRGGTLSVLHRGQDRIGGAVNESNRIARGWIGL